MVITPNELKNYFLPIDLQSYSNKGPTKFAETFPGGGFITTEGYLLPNYPPENRAQQVQVIDIWNYRLSTFFQDWGTRDCEHIELHDISNKIIPLKKASSKEEMYEDHLRRNIPNQQLLNKFVLAANQAIFGVSYSLFPSPMKHFLDSLASVINIVVKINRDSIIWVNNIYTIKLLCLEHPDEVGLECSSKNKNQPLITETLILEDYGPSNFKIQQIAVHDLAIQQYLNREYGILLPPSPEKKKSLPLRNYTLWS